MRVAKLFDEMSTGSTVSFWRAYEAAVKKALGYVDSNIDQAVFLRKPDQPFTPAGEALAEAEVNYIIYELADRLFLFDGSGGPPFESYAKDLDRYGSFPVL